MTEKTVSQQELAEIIGVTDRWVRELDKRGVFSRTGRGKYLLAESVQGYVAHIRETEVVAAAEKMSARESYEAERARKLRLANDKEERQLVPIADAAAALDYMLGEVRNDLAGVAPLVSDEVAVRRSIEDAIDTVLDALDQRFTKAGADLEAGRDPFASVDETHA